MFSFPSLEARYVSEIDILILIKQLKLAKEIPRKNRHLMPSYWGDNCDLSVLGQETAGGMVGIQRQEIQAAANDAASEAGSEAILQKGQSKREARESRAALPSKDHQHIN